MERNVKDDYLQASLRHGAEEVPHSAVRQSIAVTEPHRSQITHHTPHGTQYLPYRRQTDRGTSQSVEALDSGPHAKLSISLWGHVSN